MSVLIGPFSFSFLSGEYAQEHNRFVFPVASVRVLPDERENTTALLVVSILLWPNTHGNTFFVRVLFVSLYVPSTHVREFCVLCFTVGFYQLRILTQL